MDKRQILGPSDGREDLRAGAWGSGREDYIANKKGSKKDLIIHSGFVSCVIILPTVWSKSQL
jgi:hypothetical protein